MKKILALLLSVSMIVSMAAISASAETDDSKPQTAASVRMSAEPTERSTNFNEGWQFALGENTGAEKSTTTIPHGEHLTFPTTGVSNLILITAPLQLPSAVILTEVPVGTEKLLFYLSPWQENKFQLISAEFIWTAQSM